jgi:ABC-2 type transport system permease protein
MTGTVAARPAVEVAGGLGIALLAHAARLIRTGALIVLTVAAGMSAVVVWQHGHLYGGSLDASSLEALAGSPGIRIMFGAPVALQDPGSFTVWRTGAMMAVLVAVWAVLTTVRITRGDEEVGRWEILLAGRYRLSRLVTINLTVLVAAAAAIGAAVAVAMSVAGAEAGGAVRYGIVLALIGAGAAAWGALAAQLVNDRQRAASIAVAAVVAGFGLRMVADGVPGLAWLHWVTPFGLLGLSEPFGARSITPVVVLLAEFLALVAAVAVTSRHRDLNAGLLPVQDRRPAHSVLLRSMGRFAVRRTVGPVLGWGVGLGSYFLVVGLLASSLIQFLSDNPAFADRAAAAGFGSLTTVDGYVGSMFTLLSIPLGLFAAGRISATAADEEARRLTMIFAAPVSRTRWFMTEALTALGASLIVTLVAGVAAWVGTLFIDAELPATAALAGVLNVAPIMMVSLAAALFALGWIPKAVLPVGAIPAAGGFLLQVLADSLGWPEWISMLSPYAHVGLVPYEQPDWTGAVGLVAVAVILAILGLYGYSRRDLRG